MKINIHHPVLELVDTHDGFHTIYITDTGGGSLVLFVKADWSDWDHLVAAVAAYRTEVTA